MKALVLSILLALISIPLLAQKAEQNKSFRNASISQVIDCVSSMMGKTVSYENVTIPAATWSGTLRINVEELNQFLTGFKLHATVEGNILHITSPQNIQSVQLQAPPINPIYIGYGVNEPLNTYHTAADPTYYAPLPYNGYNYGYYNPVPLIRSFRKFGVENQFGAFKISGSLPSGGTRNVKVCVDGLFRDEATNIHSWTDPSAGLTSGNHIIELRDLGRMRAFKEEVYVEPKAVTETFGGNRFKINLYVDRIEAQDSYKIKSSCPGNAQ